jgi:hypothetical protein
VFANGFDSQAKLINNLLIGNMGQNAVVCGTLDGASVPAFESNDAFSVAGLAYSGSCPNQTGLNGNISADPIFVDAGAGDYHVLNGSPVIDSASASLAPSTDLDGRARPADGNGDGIVKFDMGVYEVPDTIPPVTTSDLSPAPNSSGWNNTNTVVTLTATDSGNPAGVQSIRYVLSGAQTSNVIVGGNPTTISVTAEGLTTVQYSATDNAGNVEPDQSLIVRIDKTAPAIAGMPAAGCTLSPPKHQMVQVAVVTASDSLSGVASLSVTATSSEPDSGVGGGDLPGDIVIDGGIVHLRAERAPSGKGRTYTISATATDISGNSTTSSATCSVPK